MNEGALHDRKVFLDEAEALLGRSDYLTALSLAESRLKQTPGDMDARTVICRVWIEQEKLAEAEEMLREMENILASLSQIYTCMGDICYRKGMAESAEAFYRTFVSLNPDTPKAAEIAEKLTIIAEQIEADRLERQEKGEVVQVPDVFQTVTLAELYVRQGHPRMAEEILQAILSRGFHHPKAADLLRVVREEIAHREAAGEKVEPGIPWSTPEEIAEPDAAGQWDARETQSEIPESVPAPEEPAGTPVADLLRELREEIAHREAAGEKVEPGIPWSTPEEIAEPDAPRQWDARATRSEIPESVPAPEEIAIPPAADKGCEPEALPVVQGGSVDRFERLETAPELRREAPEGIATRTVPDNKRVAELLRELTALREKIAQREKLEQRHAPVIAELTRWLNNIGRLRNHAA